MFKHLWALGVIRGLLSRCVEKYQLLFLTLFVVMFIYFSETLLCSVFSVTMYLPSNFRMNLALFGFNFCIWYWGSMN